MVCILWEINGGGYRHLGTFMFTLFNVFLTIMFTVMLVPQLITIDDVGLVRYRIFT